ncbi:DUF1643 domain-containing protein [Seohaeicola zhoushanensis]|uniref:DUF1643 domain-containing protein n=1 Tax=Seohaeicola zhoushanensis TaxID=1569283 RepID=A0A8J3GX25_9RHOB|nr:hypothetical protein GCM10017056_24120 [Seohaeicola zhoushanensis]
MSLVRAHLADGVASRVVYSVCEAYRYSLTRVWDEAGPRLAFVMLNPSKADEMRNDPTVARCEARARAMGFGGYEVVNLFAWRATDPRDLKAAAEPVGPDNDAAILAAAGRADAVLAAWGAHGVHRGRGAAVREMLRGCGRPLLVLGLTKDGAPRHPLYIASARQAEPWG